MYLAVLSQSGATPAFIRTVALVCNALVTANGFMLLKENGWHIMKRIWPLLLASVPACVATGFIQLDSSIYFITLASALMLAACMMLLRMRMRDDYEVAQKTKVWIYPASFIIGALAGFTGIGGGVYLSPLLYLSRWDKPKNIAATSAAFIFINSLASLLAIGLRQGWSAFESLPISLPLAAVVGGFIGASFSGKLLSQRSVHFITVLLLIFVSIRIYLRYL